MRPDADMELRDFRRLYREHYGFVWHALRRFGTASAVLDDATQDVFVVAYRRRADYRGTSTRAWLYGIARRIASNYRRSMRRHAQRERATEGTRATQAGARETIEAFDRYLASLRPEDRELFILSEVEGMTGPEIAEACGRNLHTIYTRIRTLRLHLRDRLEPPEHVVRARPRATARSWAVLVPLLRRPTTLPSTALATAWPWIASTVGAGSIASALVLGPWGPASSKRTDTHTTIAAASLPRAVDTPNAGPPTTLEPPRPIEHTVTERPAAPATRRGTAPRPASARTSTLAIENELLRRASAELERGDAAGALRTTTEHAERFPTSALADLRTAVRIEALCAQGKPTEARAEAEALLRLRPGSPVARRIERSCISTGNPA